MKKFIWPLSLIPLSFVVAIAFLVIPSCDSTVTKYPSGERYSGQDIEIMVIDSCEYVIVSGDSRSLTHKGNCKFCAQRAKRATYSKSGNQVDDNLPDTAAIVSYKHPFSAGKIYTTSDKSATYISFSFRDSIVAVAAGRDTMDFEYEHHGEFKKDRIYIMFLKEYFVLEKINKDTLVSADGITYHRIRPGHSQK